jgi:glycosidase
LNSLVILALSQTLGTTPHEFVFRGAKITGESIQAITSVSVAGSFNGWDRNAAPLALDPDGRTWRRTLPLPYGSHTYKFVVNGRDWINDPGNPDTQDDGTGIKNSFINLLPPAYEKPAQKGDGEITRYPIRHLPETPWRNYDRGMLTLSLAVRPNDVQQVRAIVNGKSYDMTRSFGNDLVEMRQVRIPWNAKDSLRYKFSVIDGSEKMELGMTGLGEKSQEWSLSSQNFTPFSPPEWAERAVLYQIFPDRFRNGCKTNDPQDVVAWDATPTYRNFFGGDVKGIQESIPYLRDLGIDGIYFNPVFASPANHRYEATDFLKIDPRFGTNEEFTTLTQDLERNGIRTILDGVFNHTATDFPQFADVLKNQRSSPFVDWWFIRNYPVKVQQNPPYEAWFGFESMPKINTENPAVREYFWQVLKYWHNSARIHGWRLDVANEVPMDFWRAFRTRVKAKSQDAWIVGEVWGDGSPWLKGDQWDSVMNYQFRNAALDWIARGKDKPSQLMDRLMAVHHSLAPQVSRNLMTLLGSHDTPRFLNEAGGDVSLLHLAAILQLTWIGTPTIYYGDEIAMNGGRDPLNRKGMEWDRANGQNATLSLYQKLIRIRKSSEALLVGDPIPLLTDDSKQVAVFARVSGKDIAIVGLNRSTSSQTVQIQVPASHQSAFASTAPDVLNGRSIPVRQNILTLTLSARSGAIVLPKEPRQAIHNKSNRKAS